MGWEKVFVFRHGGILVNLHGSAGSTRGANWFRSYCSVTGKSSTYTIPCWDGGDETEEMEMEMKQQKRREEKEKMGKMNSGQATVG